MVDDLRMLDVGALNEDMREHGLLRGQVATRETNQITSPVQTELSR